MDLENLEHLQNHITDKECDGVVLIGRDRALVKVQRLVDLAASTNANVLVTGETGTGKNVVAKAIHCNSTAWKGSLVSINCAAIPGDLLEAELFGYEKGAFTSAVTAKKGIFELADGGTLLLDEIGEMPLHLQSKLLGVLEDKKIRRLGGESTRQVDIRIIATTNLDLEDAVKTKAFRKDLFYRLSVLRIHMPPLRERRVDIPELCGHFINKIAGGCGLKLPDAEVSSLMEYDWPGNVRELQNLLERSVMLQKGPDLRPSELLARPDRAAKSCMPFMAKTSDSEGIATLKDIEKNYIKYAFERFSGNYTRTAKALGISISTLKRKLKDIGLP